MRCTYLGATVSWESVVPQFLEWSSNWDLVLAMIAMSKNGREERGENSDRLHFERGETPIESTMWRRKLRKRVRGEEGEGSRKKKSGAQSILTQFVT